MKYKIFDTNTGNEIPESEAKLLPSYRCSYDFESYDDALMEIAFSGRQLRLSSRNFNQIEEHTTQLNVGGLNIIHHYIWREYIYYVAFGYVHSLGKVKRPPKPKYDNPDEIINNQRVLIEKLKNDVQYLENQLEHEVDNEYDKPTLPSTNEINKLKLNLKNYQETVDISDLKSDDLSKPNNFNDVSKPIDVSRIPDTITQLPASVNLEDDIDYTYIYVLYCEQTPNIFYVGMSKTPESRFKAHSNNNPNNNSKLKYEWIEYLNEKKYQLKYRIIDKICDKNYQTGSGLSLETKWMEKFIENEKFCVLNFTTSHYSANDQNIRCKFNYALHKKKYISLETAEELLPEGFNNMTSKPLLEATSKN